jgi:N-acetylmuramoyl-L-alanine amidase
MFCKNEMGKRIAAGLLMALIIPVVSAVAAERGTEADSKISTYTVVIDPGHQGSWVDMSGTEPIGPGASEQKAMASTGTQSPYTGLAEYELNLNVSLLLREELENRGYEVIMTREDNDTAISNAERALVAYEEGGDIFIRIHANGASDSSVSGALAMVPSPENPYVADLSESSYQLAQCVLDGYCEKAGFSSQGVQYYDDMSGINWSRLPVMILEMGFMTNQSDDARMADEAVQHQMAEGIADGIDLYFSEEQ